ncbi:MAG: ATP-binding protein [Acidimicrobiales bacterium]
MSAAEMSAAEMSAAERSAGGSGTSAGGAEVTTVVLQVEGPGNSVRLARLTAAALCAELDFDIEAVEDVRIAVDELVSFLNGGGGALTVTYRCDGDGLEISGAQLTGPTGPVGPERLSEMAEAIVAATTDSFEVGGDAARRWFVLRKRGG